MDLILLTLPWTLLTLYLVVRVRLPRPLPPPGEWREGEAPFVSIVVPARDEERNVSSLLASLAATEYPKFEVIVVDDQSSDRTPELVEGAPRRNAWEIRLLRGETPPAGWFGKPWACFQGAKAAGGDLLLFCDADTVHGPMLLGRTVRTLLESEADALTLLGKQVMGSFWERLLQPQFFMLLGLRFPRAGSPPPPRRWRDAIANGQYMLFRRDAYEGFGGHHAVRGEVVEDMRLAQLLVRTGRRLILREGPELRTRMYTSLPELVEGWSKNVATAALQVTGGWLQPWILPLSLLLGFILWLLPPLVLGWAVVTGAGGTLLLFGALTTGYGVVLWGLVTAVMGGNPLMGVFFPLGSCLTGYICLRSWVRGARIRWKGREYRMAAEVRRGGGLPGPGKGGTA